MGGSLQDDFVREVRVAADIGRLVSEYVSLKTSGRKLKGLCPFHDEKTPSFIVDPEKQLFYCFGCRTGGDVFKFVMLTERLPFPDALRQLAAKFGVPLPRKSAGAGSTTRLLEMLAAAASFYRSCLMSRQGTVARDYLKGRGLTRETVEQLGIGFAPDSWDGLKTHLRQKGYKEEELLKAGLVARRKQGQGTYDWLRNRIVFPIERISGGVIGFGGRLMGEGEPKYLNSPETEVFSKGRHLYGLTWSRDAMRQDEHAVIVEGYMDFAALWHAGVRNAVAVLGTGFTREHGRLLGRLAQRVVINFDADRAGRQATDRTVSLLLEQDFEIGVLELPDGQDPDDFVRARGAEVYREWIAAAPSFVDYLLAWVCEGKDLSRPETKAQAVSQLLPRLSGMGNRVLRAAALARIAERLDLPEEAVRDEFHRQAAGPQRAGETPAAGRVGDLAGRSRGTPAERQLLHLLLFDAAARDRLLAQMVEEDLAGLATERLFVALLGQHRAGHEISVASLEQILAPEDRGRLMEIAMSDFPQDDSGQGESCWHALRKERLQRESHRLQRQLQESAAGVGNAAQMDDLLRRKLELRRMIDALS